MADPRLSSEAIRQQKQQIRQQLRGAGVSIEDGASDQIQRLVQSLPEWRTARCISIYVARHGEVDTEGLIRHLLQDNDRRLAVPYCVGRDLHLFALSSWEHLAAGRFGILEPREELREDRRWRVRAEEVDLFVVPGLAFTPTGERLGNGWGFYDRLLAQRRSDSALIGLAHQCQLLDALPIEPHDITMDLVVTELGILRMETGNPRG